MNLKGIISISGRPGLFKVVAQGKNNVIVESLEDKKRFPAYASDRISALEDISIYTYDEDKPLKEIYLSIFEKEDGKETISHKESADKMKAYLMEILPDYDQQRVYSSDIKKLFQWYNLLHKSGQLHEEEEAEDSEGTENLAEDTEKKEVKKTKAKSSEETETSDKDEKADKKPAAKKAPAKKASATAAKPKTAAPKKAASPKASSVKKAPSKTGGTSRGK